MLSESYGELNNEVFPHPSIALQHEIPFYDYTPPKTMKRATQNTQNTHCWFMFDRHDYVMDDETVPMFGLFTQRKSKYIDYRRIKQMSVYYTVTIYSHGSLSQLRHGILVRLWIHGKSVRKHSWCWWTQDRRCLKRVQNNSIQRLFAWYFWCTHRFTYRCFTVTFSRVMADTFQCISFDILYNS